MQLRTSRLFLTATLALAASATQALTVTVADMNAAEWTAVTVSHSDPSTLTLSTSASGGNGGSFWRQDWSAPSTTLGASFGDRRANIYTLASYDPGTSGALGTLSIGYDFVRLASTFTNGSAGFLSAAIEQGGRIFIQATGSTQVFSSDWQSTSFSSALATDWVELGSNANPDFSAAGDELHFGYRYSVNASCPNALCTSVITSAGVDNFQVQASAAQIAAVPEPQTWALMLGGLWLLVGVAHRRPRGAVA